jgi:predicted aldo/keto reductase-like oxidoreductase
MGVMRADNPAVVRAALKSGITHFDTANGYQRGTNEVMLGEFFKDKDRSSFTIATKGKPAFGSDNLEEELENLLNTSLSRLQMDYVDIYYAHALGSVEEVKNPKLISALKKFKADGKARHIGFSTHANKPEQIDAAIEAGIYEVILLSYNFKLDILPELNAAIQRGVDAGIGFVAMKTMVGGGTEPQGERGGGGRRGGGGFGGGGNGEPVDGAACLRWVWQNPNITTAIPGFTSFELLDNCLLAAHSPELTEADRNYLAGLSESQLLYCQNCEHCLADCKKSLPVPDIMRAYMYNFGYRQPALAKDTLMELALGSLCSGCNSCTVKCPQGFRVKEKIAAITPIIDVPDGFLV